ncbi:MAG: UDP-N-acetylmuramoyl-L-alanine--D-glutamate ligase [Clostridiales bacterium]|uniref:UDP-N-acetylmuramoyl-L-alanine--D-glutamate ligase n=1 Tax=Clostridium sp. N3C TaxID=1776758 RepID=UPI00092DEAD0|nr:UDP-N-acetylmuramoyl-L-alanine--D-glutamate ligase [Clostridium sp. N3C]NLZ49534.1 UDP-N-acetylmuramoyl-L-alanine--D-glutamate ligase [Clostridiales bacterium]SCN23172.1 UDP-N-acetylmuramoylalanine-D-glutamate ligase [Clostridium sp. N3C]
MKKDFKEFKAFIKNKKTAVVGIGVSNIPLINFLIELGAKVTAFDKKSLEDLGDVGRDFINKGVELSLGENYLDSLKGFDVVFKTPSMRIDSPALQRAKAEGAYITSEMEEFMRYCPAKIYAVTGSDGKTTTTSIIYNLLKEQGFKTWVGGNIGTPLFSKIEEITPQDRVVLELSSFQLMTINVSPEVAVITNITPNHLDMHKDMEEYIDAKRNIFRYQGQEDILVLNRENDITNSFQTEAKAKIRLFSSKTEITDGGFYKDGALFIDGHEVCKKDEITIKGMHNVENYLAAFLAVKDEVSREVMKKIAVEFKGVEHRNELIREVKGVKYYNDSIGSSPTRTLATISVFDKPVILIAGGYDKHIPFEPLAEKGWDKVKSLVLLGDTKDKIKEVFLKVIRERNINIPIFMTGSLEEAVKKCQEIAEAGDYVVLSPACASFDMFPNFEVRGNKFKEIVNSL